MNQNRSLISVTEALEQLLAAVRPVQQVEVVRTLEANGRVLASDQYSLLDVPPRDNTQMDGYAVRTADCVSGTARMPVSQRIPAGHVGEPLQAGTVARIFTGAMIPEGADAVVMQEQCEFEPAAADETNGLDHVTIRHQPKSGEWIRRAGEDIRAKSVILPAGARLHPQQLGMAASVGLAELPVVRRLRVGVFYTGDELAMPGEQLKPGAIYNSNRFILHGLLQNFGCEIEDYGIVPDTLEATRGTLRRAAERNDLIITSGGVSVGEEDHIKPAVEAEGHINMWQISVKPGKPLAFGEVRRPETGGTTQAQDNDTAFFLGLPGNPVSSLVTFALFVRPFMLRLQGVADVIPKRYPMRADFVLDKKDRRNEFLRARVNAEGGLDLFSNQSSGVLTSAVWSDGLIDNPAETTIAQGELVQFIPFSELLF